MVKSRSLAAADRPPCGARLLAVLVALSGIAVGLFGNIPTATAAATGLTASDRGIANPPAWASGKKVHFYAAPADAQPPAAPRGSRGGFCQTGCGQGTPPLLYHNGPVQQTPQVHLIYWGSNWYDNQGFQAQNEVNELFGELNGSSYQGVLTQYYGPPGTYTSLSGVSVSSWTDTSVTAPTGVNDARIRDEVARAISQTGWSRTANAQFVVLTAPETTYASGFDTGFCGYHGDDSSGSVYAFDPYPDLTFGNCAHWDPSGNQANALSFVSSHEYAEAVNDPHLNAWYDSSGYEIADDCVYAGEATLPNGVHANYLWSNQIAGCAA